MLMKHFHCVNGKGFWRESHRAKVVLVQFLFGLCVWRCECVLLCKRTCVLGQAASVGVLVALSCRRLLKKGSEGRADGSTTERLLHAEVVHHTLLYFLLSWGEEKAPEDRQLIMADFYVLLHNNPGDRLCQRGCCQRAVVRPIVISLGG